MSDVVNKFGGDENLNDELEHFSRVLESLIVNNINCAKEKTAEDNGLVIAIDAKWGSGKTTFLNIFRKEIEQRPENHICSYDFRTSELNIIEKKKVILIKYNAWENDYFNDPLLSLIGQFCSQHSSLNEKQKRGLKRIAKKLFPFATDVLSHLVGELPKNIIATVPDVIKEIKRKAFDEELNMFKNLSNLLEEFKDALTKLGKSKNHQEVIKIVLVDELDRCKPQFAVNFLEILKHFFNASNVVFVVALNKETLVEHIKHYYGYGIDGVHYLSRFFDFDLKLPTESDAFHKCLMCEYNQDRSPSYNFMQQMADFFGCQVREKIKYLRYWKQLRMMSSSDAVVAKLILAIKMFDLNAYRFIQQVVFTTINATTAQNLDLVQIKRLEFLEFMKKVCPRFETLKFETPKDREYLSKIMGNALFEGFEYLYGYIVNPPSSSDLDIKQIIKLVNCMF